MRNCTAGGGKWLKLFQRGGKGTYKVVDRGGANGVEKVDDELKEKDREEKRGHSIWKFQGDDGVRYLVAMKSFHDSPLFDLTARGPDLGQICLSFQSLR